MKVQPEQNSLRNHVKMLTLETMDDGFCSLFSIEDFVFFLHNCKKQRIDRETVFHLHTFVCQIGVDSQTLLGNYVLSMYVETGCLQMARKVFDKLLYKNDVSWNSLINGYIEWERPHASFSMYERMRNDDSLCVSGYTYVALLKSCEKVKELQRGFQIHMDVVYTGLINENVYVCSTLVNMYAKFGMLKEAQKVFDIFPCRDIVLWTVLIAGYADHGYGNQAIHCFEQMRVEGISPNDVTLLCMLKACITIGSIQKGQQIHCEITKEEKESVERAIFLRSNLVYIYARCGDFIMAEHVFDSLPIQDVVSWTTLISGYVEYGIGDKALVCYERMQLQAISPNIATFVCSLKACASVRMIGKGQEMHVDIEKKGLLEGDIALGIGLIDMYTKCGALDTAKQVFDKIPTRNVVSWTALIGGYVEHGHAEEALEYFELMEVEGVSPNSVTFILSLKACGNIGNRVKGEEICNRITMEGLLEKDLAIGNTLIDFYAKYGMLSKACDIFHSLPIRNIVSWNVLITGYAEHRHYNEALEIFQEMQVQRVSPDAFTFLSILGSCGSNQYAEKGLKLHVEIEKQGLLQGNHFLESALVDMYGKCGLLASAECVFGKIRVKGLVAWTSMISGYTEHSYFEEALECLEKMKSQSVSPTGITLACGLKVCGQIQDEVKGQELLAEVERQGLLVVDHILGNAVVDMYAKCSSLVKAHEVFDRVHSRNVTLWNTLLSGYLEHGYSDRVFELVDQLNVEGISPDAFTFICTLKASIAFGSIGNIMDIHATLEKQGMLKGDVGNTLVDMYAKCGWLDMAEQVFDKIEVKDVVSWNALITGYFEHGQPRRAIQCFEKMEDLGVLPNIASIVSILKACGSIGALKKAQSMHAKVENRGLLERDMFLGSALIIMYADCGSFSESHETFKTMPIRTVVLWNALMTGYIENGNAEEALKNFYKMQLEGIYPDPETFLCSVKACAMLGDIKKGYEMDACIKSLGICEGHFAVDIALIYMYASCGLLVTAQEVFDKIEVQDVSAWTAIIAGYTKQGCDDKALKCYEQMQLQGISANPYISSSILKACGNIKAAEKGQEIHSNMTPGGLLETNIIVGTALVGMYMKCGLPAKAQEIFNKLNSRNVICWNTLLSGYTEHGNSEEAINVYEFMQLDGISPDATTFRCSLKACDNYSEKGQIIHIEINKHNLLERDISIRNTLIDMYAKYGFLVKAQEMFDVLQFRNVISWNALMASFSRFEHNEETIECLEKMQLEGISPNEVSFLCILKACANTGAVEKGQEIHGEIEKRGMLLGDCHPIGNALVDMYAKCGSVFKAQQVFNKLVVQDVVSWTIILSGYVQIGDGNNISLTLERMLYVGIKPDDVTFTVLLSACSQTGLMNKSHMYMHDMYTYHGVGANLKHHTCIIDMFGRVGRLDLALITIDKMPFPPNLVVWHSVLESCKKLGNVELGKSVFEHTLNLDEKMSTDFFK